LTGGIMYFENTLRSTGF